MANSTVSRLLSELSHELNVDIPEGERLSVMKEVCDLLQSKLPGSELQGLDPEVAKAFGDCKTSSDSVSEGKCESHAQRSPPLDSDQSTAVDKNQSLVDTIDNYVIIQDKDKDQPLSTNNSELNVVTDTVDLHAEAANDKDIAVQSDSSELNVGKGVIDMHAETANDKYIAVQSDNSELNVSVDKGPDTAVQSEQSDERRHTCESRTSCELCDKLYMTVSLDRHNKVEGTNVNHTGRPGGSDVDHTGRPGGTDVDHTGHPGGTDVDHTGRPGGTNVNHTGRPRGTDVDHSARPGGTDVDHTGRPGGTDVDHTGRPGGTDVDHTGRPGGTDVDHTGRPGGTDVDHTGRPFHCDFCNYSPTFHWQLVKHLRRHTGTVVPKEKPEGEQVLCHNSGLMVCKELVDLQTETPKNKDGHFQNDYSELNAGSSNVLAVLLTETAKDKNIFHKDISELNVGNAGSADVLAKTAEDKHVLNQKGKPELDVGKEGIALDKRQTMMSLDKPMLHHDSKSKPVQHIWQHEKSKPDKHRQPLIIAWQRYFYDRISKHRGEIQMFTCSVCKITYTKIEGCKKHVKKHTQANEVTIASCKAEPTKLSTQCNKSSSTCKAAKSNSISVVNSTSQMLSKGDHVHMSGDIKLKYLQICLKDCMAFTKPKATTSFQRKDDIQNERKRKFQVRKDALLIKNFYKQQSKISLENQHDNIHDHKRKQTKHVSEMNVLNKTGGVDGLECSIGKGHMLDKDGDAKYTNKPDVATIKLENDLDHPYSALESMQSHTNDNWLQFDSGKSDVAINSNLEEPVDCSQLCEITGKLIGADFPTNEETITEDVHAYDPNESVELIDSCLAERTYCSTKDVHVAEESGGPFDGKERTDGQNVEPASMNHLCPDILQNTDTNASPRYISGAFELNAVMEDKLLKDFNVLNCDDINKISNSVLNTTGESASIMPVVVNVRSLANEASCWTEEPSEHKDKYIIGADTAIFVKKTATKTPKKTAQFNEDDEIEIICQHICEEEKRNKVKEALLADLQRMYADEGMLETTIDQERAVIEGTDYLLKEHQNLQIINFMEQAISSSRKDNQTPHDEVKNKSPLITALSQAVLLRQEIKEKEAAFMEQDKQFSLNEKIAKQLRPRGKCSSVINALKQLLSHKLNCKKGGEIARRNIEIARRKRKMYQQNIKLKEGDLRRKELEIKKNKQSHSHENVRDSAMHTASSDCANVSNVNTHTSVLSAILSIPPTAQTFVDCVAPKKRREKMTSDTESYVQPKKRQKKGTCNTVCKQSLSSVLIPTRQFSPEYSPVTICSDRGELACSEPSHDAVQSAIPVSVKTELPLEMTFNFAKSTLTQSTQSDVFNCGIVQGEKDTSALSSTNISREQAIDSLPPPQTVADMHVVMSGSQWEDFLMQRLTSLIEDEQQVKNCYPYSQIMLLKSWIIEVNNTLNSSCTELPPLPINEGLLSEFIYPILKSENRPLLASFVNAVNRWLEGATAHVPEASVPLRANISTQLANDQLDSAKTVNKSMKIPVVIGETVCYDSDIKPPVNMTGCQKAVENRMEVEDNNIINNGSNATPTNKSEGENDPGKMHLYTRQDIDFLLIHNVRPTALVSNMTHPVNVGGSDSANANQQYNLLNQMKQKKADLEKILSCRRQLDIVDTSEKSPDKFPDINEGDGNVLPVGNVKCVDNKQNGSDMDIKSEPVVCHENLDELSKVKDYERKVTAVLQLVFISGLGTWIYNVDNNVINDYRVENMIKFHGMWKKSCEEIKTQASGMQDAQVDLQILKGFLNNQLFDGCFDIKLLMKCAVKLDNVGLNHVDKYIVKKGEVYCMSRKTNELSHLNSSSGNESKETTRTDVANMTSDNYEIIAENDAEETMSVIGGSNLCDNSCSGVDVNEFERYKKVLMRRLETELNESSARMEFLQQKADNLHKINVHNVGAESIHYTSNVHKLLELNENMETVAVDALSEAANNNKDRHDISSSVFHINESICTKPYTEETNSIGNKSQAASRSTVTSGHLCVEGHISNIDKLGLHSVDKDNREESRLTIDSNDDLKTFESSSYVGNLLALNSGIENYVTADGSQNNTDTIADILNFTVDDTDITDLDLKCTENDDIVDLVD